MATEKTFLELVEFHERKWGTEEYPGRPALKLLLNLPVVAVWRSGNRFMFSVYTRIEELNRIINGLLTGTMQNPENRTLYKVFHFQKEVEFAVKLVNAATWKRPLLTDQPAEDQSELKQTKPLKSETKTNGEWQYPDQPAVIDSNPQRELREANPYVPPYIPQVVSQRGQPPIAHVNGAQRPRKHTPVPGHPTPGHRLPGRQVSIIRTYVDRNNGRK